MRQTGGHKVSRKFCLKVSVQASIFCPVWIHLLEHGFVKQQWQKTVSSWIILKWILLKVSNRNAIKNMWNPFKLNSKNTRAVSYDLFMASLLWTFSRFYICDALGDLGSFVLFKKREKHPWRSVTFSKVAG